MSITIKRPTTIITLCTDMDLQAAHERAVADMERAQKNTVMENTGVPELAREVAAIEEQMRDSTLEFTLRALPRKQFNEFEAANPPRDGDKIDAALGVNVSALDTLIVPSIAGVTQKGEPVAFDPASEWGTLADDMTDGQWNKFALASLQINRGATQVPFSRAASLAIRKSEQS